MLDILACFRQGDEVSMQNSGWETASEWAIKAERNGVVTLKLMLLTQSVRMGNGWNYLRIASNCGP